MKSTPPIIDLLNDVLSGELTAINQYFIHAKMLADWGYTKLAKYTRAESIDEMKHAEVLMERILYLEGLPNVQRLFKINVGTTVPEQFQSDLALEVAAIERLNNGIALAVQTGDNGTRELLAEILVDEERHADWLETQLETINQIGLPHYLAQQIDITEGA